MVAKANVNVTIELDEQSVREVLAEWVSRNYGAVDAKDITFNIGQRQEGHQMDPYTVTYLKGVTCKTQPKPIPSGPTYRNTGFASQIDNPASFYDK